jgi:hypothetical protein
MVMDKVISIGTMPFGLLLCFSPVIFVWLRDSAKSSKSPPPEKPEDREPGH